MNKPAVVRIEERYFTIADDGVSEQLTHTRIGPSGGEEIDESALFEASGVQVGGMHFGGPAFDRLEVHRGEAGHITSVEQFRGDQVVGTLTMEYDARGRRAKIVHEVSEPPGGAVVTTFAYDGADRVIERTTSLETLIIDSVRYSYDTDGLLIGEVSEDENGRRVATVFRYLVNDHGDWTEQTVFRIEGSEERAVSRVLRTITYSTSSLR
jgi:hypothetical protein